MRRVLFSALLAFMMVGCGNDTSNDVTLEAPYEAGSYVVFDATGGDIPYPNNILFAANSSSTNDADGVTLNIPYEPTDSDASVKHALNELDGFSTTSPITVSFNGEINASSLYGNIHLYEIGAAGIASELTFHVPNLINGDYVATTSGNKIVILPVKPLKSATNYAVVLTNGIVDNDKKPIAPDVASELLLRTTPLVDANGNHTTLNIDDATTFEGIRQLTQQMISLTLAYDANMKREEIVSAWNFKTQTIGNVFKAIKDANKSATLSVHTTDINTTLFGGSGKADILVGAINNLPYYLGTPSKENPTAPLTSYFTDANGSAYFTGLPKLDSNKTVPILMTKPNASSLAVIAGASAPWPIVIFQHGINQNRTNVLAIADALADAGYATIAMDLPLHGLDTNTTGLMTDYERTFNVDYVAQDSDGRIISEGADEIIDTSGRHYINLSSLLTARDNVRQSASDLLVLRNALYNLNDINASRVAFIGHSLGTIASFGFLRHNTLESVTLAMPGGGIAELLNNSPAFGSEIEAGLASKGVIKGTSAYNAFILATQTVLDDADPINYAMLVGATQNIFAIEVVGDGGGNLPDQVIPNNVATAPLAGTDPLVAYLQATTLSGNSGDFIAPNKTARYNIGDHGSILSPTASLAATVSMQTQTATFVGSQGAFISIPDETLLNMDY